MASSFPIIRSNGEDLEDMPPAGPKPVGRRERNKQDKLDRIVAAARQLLRGRTASMR